MTTIDLRPIDIVIGQEMNGWDMCYGPAAEYARAVVEGRVNPAETRLDIICADGDIDALWDDAERGIGGVWALANGHVEDDSSTSSRHEPAIAAVETWPVVIYGETLNNAHLTLDEVAHAFDDCATWGERVKATCESIVRGLDHLPTLLAMR